MIEVKLLGANIKSRVVTAHQRIKRWISCLFPEVKRNLIRLHWPLLVRTLIIINKANFFGLPLADIFETVHSITFLSQVGFFMMNDWLTLHFEFFLFSFSLCLLFLLNFLLNRTQSFTLNYRILAEYFLRFEIFFEILVAIGKRGISTVFASLQFSCLLLMIRIIF